MRGLGGWWSRLRRPSGSWEVPKRRLPSEAGVLTDPAAPLRDVQREGVDEEGKAEQVGPLAHVADGVRLPVEELVLLATSGGRPAVGC
jgi:hypothetical protein